jgi:hypothetical protein
MKKHLQLVLTFSILFFSLHFLNAQSLRENLQEDINDYRSIRKEVAYLHLNKSILLQGEQLGFSGYIVNKMDLTPSDSTANLYVQIRNSKDEIILEELKRVENGVTTGVINIDKEFLPGEYTITAFTNWMRNFEEQNYFSEKIKILATNLDNTSSSNEAPEVIDAQFLPESGHLLNGIMNNVGVIVKDAHGHGLSNAKIVIKNSGDQMIGNLSLNENGIGKFAFIPKLDESYNAEISYGGKNFPVDMALQIEEEGIILSANQRNDILDLLVQTVPHHLENLKNRTFVLLVQGRKTLEAHTFEFENRNIIPFQLDMVKLDPGVNIVTIFDENRRPVAERLFFNYIDLPVEDVRQAGVTSQNDSLRVDLSFEETATRTLSVSVLPKNTVSYNRHHNIISYNLLQPYLKGVVENADRYFEDVDERKKYDLDNLLLTQGWSSYDWGNIFRNGISLDHRFEKGFEIKAKINSGRLANNDLRFLVHATSNNPILFVDVPKNSDEFIIDGVFPAEGEKIAVSRLLKNDVLVPAKISAQTFPNQIPDFLPNSNSMIQRTQVTEGKRGFFTSTFADDFLDGTEDLGEVMVTSIVDKVKERERNLNNNTFGSVSIITGRDIEIFLTLADYLRARNFTVTEDQGSFSVSSMYLEAANSRPGRSSESDIEEEPRVIDNPLGGILIYLDDMLMIDQSMFYRYPLSNIDYIEINKTGMGAGFMGNKGFIKIYSSFTSKLGDYRKSERIQEIDIPLAYARRKVFYTPKYENNHDNFFQQYGVIDWKSNLYVENGEDLSFMIKKPEVDYMLIIEGLTTDGRLIHEVKTFIAED